MVLSQKKRRKGPKKQVIASSNKTVPVSFRVCSLSPGKKIPNFQGVLCLPQGHETNVSTGPVDQVPLSVSKLPFVSQHTSLSRMLKDALSSTVPVSLKTVNSIDLSGEEDANSHESCETLAACHSPYGMSPACLSSQNHSCHHARTLDSSVVRSVSLSSGSVSCGAALLPAALPVAGVAAAVGSSSGGGRGVAPGGGVLRCSGGWCSGCMGWGGRWAFSLPFFTHAASTRT